VSLAFKPDFAISPPVNSLRVARNLFALTILLALPGRMAAQVDTLQPARADTLPPARVDTVLQSMADTVPPVPQWLRFPEPELTLQEPPTLRNPWYGGRRALPGQAGEAWETGLRAAVDSNRVSELTAHRLKEVYGQKAMDQMEADSLRNERGLIGISRKYVDLTIDGNARLEIRTERLKNERCTPIELLDPNSGCSGGFKAPRFDTELSIVSGGLLARRLHVDVDYDTSRDFNAKNNFQIYYEGLPDEIVRRVEVGTVTFRPPASRFITASIPANNFGVNATFEVGALQLQTIAATQKGSQVAERTYTVGATTVQPQDRLLRDLDFESGRFFWVVDPKLLPGYPALDILTLNPAQAPAPSQPAQVRIYRYRPSATHNGTNPNLGGITAIAIGADTTQRVNAIWELLIQGTDYYLDGSGLWFALGTRLDRNDYLAVSYTTPAGQVGTFPARDNPPPPGGAARDTLRLIVEPKVDATRPTFRHEMRQVYRVAGTDLDPTSLKLTITLNQSERPLKPGAQPTYLSQLGLSTSSDPTLFNLQDRLFPRVRDAAADQTVREAYIIFPTLIPFADSTKLNLSEVSDSLYKTPIYLLFQEGPPAKFVLRLQYNASSTGDRSTLDLDALQIRDGSEQLIVNGRVLERGVDYNISYDVGQITFLDPDGLFGTAGTTQVTARFEERGIFAIAPTSIYGVASRYSLGQTGGINLIGIYQVEQSAFNRPQLGFEASANMVGGISTDLRFKPDAVTRFFNKLTSSPAVAPSRLDVNAEFAVTRPDPNRSGQAYLEEFEGDNGVPVSLRENLWEFSSKPQFADGVTQVVGASFDSADAVQMTWQNLIPNGTGGVVELRAKDIDPSIQVAGSADQLETVLYTTLHADTAGGIVQQNNHSLWSLPARPNRPRWRSMVSALSSTGVDLSKNEFLEFWVFEGNPRTADSAHVQIVVDLGSVNEDALALAPDSVHVDSTFTGRRYDGLNLLNTEREPTGIFNAEVDDIGILSDRPDTIFSPSGPVLNPALCQRVLSNTVPVYRWGDLGARCTNGNGLLDTEDLNNDNFLNATGTAENVFRWVVDVTDPKYFVRNGVFAADSIAGWKLYRIPLRRPDFELGTPNIRLIQHLRLTVVADPDQGGSDIVARFALGRMRFLGAPWVRRAESPIASIQGATGAPIGEVVASTISTENSELGYVSPPGVTGSTSSKGGAVDEFGRQINERSLRIVASRFTQGQRAEAYFRFPSGPQNVLGYRELRVWARGSGDGWLEGDYEAFIRLGSDSRNFYEYRTRSSTTTWLPEIAVNLEVFRNMRAQIESRRLQGLPPDSATRVACGGDTISTAYVLCNNNGYLVHVGDPDVSPPNLAAVQELAAGILRVGSNASTDSAEVWIDDIRLVEPVSNLGTAMALDAHLTASDVGDFSLGYVWQDGFFQQLGQDPSYRTTGVLTAASSLRLERFLPTSLGIAMPFGVSYVRSGTNPELLTGTDIRGSDLTNLRKPESWTLAWTVSLRRATRGRSWWVRGFLDPLSLNAALTDGRSQTELSSATSNAQAYNATYALIPGRGGFGLNLGGLVDHLPGFLKNSQGGEGLRRPFVNLAPTSVRLSSGLLKNESQLTSFGVPVERSSDSLLPVLQSITDLWRNSAGMTWQPLGMLRLSGDLASTRDLRDYPDSTSLGRLVGDSRQQFLGIDVGVERDRTLTTTFGLLPRVTSWLRPRLISGSTFVLSRSLTSRDPVREIDDTAGAFILPQTLNNSRQNEIGVGFDLGGIVAGIVGDSTSLGKLARRARPFDLSDRLGHTSTYDLVAFDPGLSYMLALGGLDDFLNQEGEKAIAATETRTTSFSGGADLPFGISAQLTYSRIRSNRFQQIVGRYLNTESLQREWPSGSVRWTRTLRNGPFSLVGLGTAFRVREGVTTLPGAIGAAPTVSSTKSSSVTPDLQVGFTNGVALTVAYNALDQESENNGNLNRLNQDDINGSLNYSFPLPFRINRQKKVARSSLTALWSKAVTCLDRPSVSECEVTSDTRRQELRAGVDTDVMQTLSAGLQFSYSVNEARHINRKFSQMIITASVQLSLFAGDYR